MPRSLPNYKPYLKFFSKRWLQGSLRFECTAEERGVFADMLALANECRVRGIIQANETTPYPHSWIASQLNIRLVLLEKCLATFTTQGRISEDGTGIKIINFDFYQSQCGLKRKNEEDEPHRERKKISDDPDKYKKGKYGHMVVSTKEDLDKLEKEREK